MSTAPESLTESLRRYVNAHADEREFIAQCAATAWDSVDRLIGECIVPDDTRLMAVLEVGANLYARRVARSSRPAFTDTGLVAAAPLPALDPLTPAYPILARYLGPVIA